LSPSSIITSRICWLVAKDMREDSDSLDEYIQALDRRIRSMAGAHARC
jgi:hypothetical protein